MNEFLRISFRLDTRLTSEDIRAFLEHCFDDLECSRSGPDGENDALFSYSAPETDWQQVTGSDSTVEEAIRVISRSEAGTVWLWYDDLNVGVNIHRSDDDSTPPSISLSIDEWYTKPWWDNQPSLIYEFVLQLYDYLSPIYVYGDTYLDDSSLSAAALKTGRLETVYWVNGFGPEMAGQIGRERLLNAPAWRIDDCDDSGVFLWASPLPHSDIKTENMDALRSYFDLE